MTSSLYRPPGWVRLAAALLVLSFSLRASAADAPPPDAPEAPARASRHIMAWHLDVSPLYIGFGRGPHTEELDETYGVRMHAAVSYDYLYRFGIFRVGAGVRSALVIDRIDKPPNLSSPQGARIFSAEVSVPLLLSAAHTFQGGSEMALTAGLGYCGAWIPGFYTIDYPDEPTSSAHGVHAELLASLAVPASDTLDFSVRSGLAFGYMQGVRAFMARAYIPLEVGLRMRW